jgi:hypothetical protein
MGKARAAFEAVGVFGKDGLQAVEALEIKAKQLAADAARRVSDSCTVVCGHMYSSMRTHVCAGGNGGREA